MTLLNIQYLKINNYRNLEGVTITFHEQASFIVGENNIGKTNILDLLHIIFNKRGFYQTDFKDENEEIRIEIKLGLHEGELGIFDDYFSVGVKKDSIEIDIVQETIDDNIRFYEKNSNDELHRRQMKNAHFISYGSVRNPNKELNFNVTNNFLSKLIEKTSQEREYLNMSEVDELVGDLNEYIDKIKTFDLFDIKAKVDSNITSLLGRIIQLQSGDEFEIKELGEGAQFLNSIPLVLLNQIVQILDKVDNDSVITLGEEKLLYLMVSIDEPELHLHPHSQRFFINYLNEIIRGENTDFNNLLKSVFDIDRIQGQIIMVTHSPYVLMNDYKQIIRVYHEPNKKIQAKSGMNIILTQSEEKRIESHIYEWKEAFYSKGVLLVEGISEKGAFKSFFKKLDYNLDLNGISIIESDGYKGMPALIKLFSKLNIHVVGVVDKDSREIPTIEEDIFDEVKQLVYQTINKEFEDEILPYIDFDSYLTLLPYMVIDKNPFSHLLRYFKDIGLEKPGTDIINSQEKLHKFLLELTKDKRDEIYFRVEKSFLKSLKELKGYNFGVQAGESLSEVPAIYKESIEKLISMINNE